MCPHATSTASGSGGLGMRPLSWLALWAVAAHGHEGKGHNCSLSSLDVWAGGSLLELTPDFSSHVHHYKASPLDFAADPIWVEPTPRERNCAARRADQGKEVPVGGSGEISVATNGANPVLYSVKLHRNKGEDDTLADLSLLHTRLSPDFQPDQLHYSAPPAPAEHEAVLVVGPVDMGQALEVILTDHRDFQLPAREKQQTLESLRWRRRNFTLGVWERGSYLQPEGNGSGHIRWHPPLEVLVHVWPAKVSADGIPKGKPAKTYSIVLQKPGSTGDSASTISPKSLVAAFLAALACCALLGVMYSTSQPLAEGRHARLS